MAFIDVYLKRRFVERADMRLSFPYFLGASIWTWLHTIGERAAEFQSLGKIEDEVSGFRSSKGAKMRGSVSSSASAVLVDSFAEFLPLFGALYPCPYCRHHLNEQIWKNGERNLCVSPL